MRDVVLLRLHEQQAPPWPEGGGVEQRSAIGAIYAVWTCGKPYLAPSRASTLNAFHW